MNWKMLIGSVVLFGVLVYATGSGALQLNMIQDVGVEESTAKEYVQNYDDKVIDFLEDTDFPKPSQKAREVYELRLKDGTTKLKLFVNWENDYIQILDEDSGEEPDLLIIMGEGTYNSLVRELQEAIEKREAVLSGGWELEDHIIHGQIVLSTEVRGQSKTKLVNWAVNNAPEAREEAEKLQE